MEIDVGTYAPPAADVAVSEVYLYPGQLHAEPEPALVTTVLGSCIAVCLWDEVAKIGGINHFMLPLWNGDGLPSPKYGNVAISKLVERMILLGSRRTRLVAKVFGGGAVLDSCSGFMNVGERNIELAQDMLRLENIPIVGGNVGDRCGRKIIFRTDTGEVLMKRVAKTIGESR